MGYNGIECSRKSDNKNLLMDENILKLVIVSRLSAEKGIDVALRAIKILINKGLNLHLDVVGDDNILENQQAKLEVLCTGLALKQYVTFHGGVQPQDVPKFILQADIVLIPSRYESFGLVAVEAGFLSRPVIASDVGGLREVIKHNETGVLVEPENPECLAQAIINLNESKNKMATMGKNAKKWVENNFSIQKSAENYQKIYRRLITVGSYVK